MTGDKGNGLSYPKVRTAPLSRRQCGKSPWGTTDRAGKNNWGIPLVIQDVKLLSDHLQKVQLLFEHFRSKSPTSALRRDGMVGSAVASTVANAGAVAATGRNSCDDTGVNPLYTPPSPGGRSQQGNRRFGLSVRQARMVYRAAGLNSRQVWPVLFEQLCLSFPMSHIGPRGCNLG